MDSAAVILSRIEPLMVNQGLNPSTLSLKATEGRSKDLIRNWQRAAKEGRPTSMRLQSVALVAAALGVSETWLASGEGSMDSVTDEERDLLAAYRLIPPEKRAGHLTAAIQTLRLGHATEDPEEEEPAVPQHLQAEINVTRWHGTPRHKDEKTLRYWRRALKLILRIHGTPQPRLARGFLLLMG